MHASIRPTIVSKAGKEPFPKRRFTASAEMQSEKCLEIALISRMGRNSTKYGETLLAWSSNHIR